jgi:heme/copper-type cytochrome/quinol oxidase subunit 2
VTLTAQEQPFSDQTLIILIAIVAIIIVAIVIIAFASRKRPRKSTDDDISAPLHSVSISNL